MPGQPDDVVRRSDSLGSGTGTKRGLPSCRAAFQIRQEAPVLRTRTQLPEDAREELARITPLAHDVVESASDCGAAFLRRRWLGRDRDEYPLTEVRFGTQPRGQHGNRLHMSKKDNYHFELGNDLVRRPFARLYHAKTHLFERKTVRRFATADVDDEHRAPFHRNTSPLARRFRNGRASG